MFGCASLPGTDPGGAGGAALLSLLPPSGAAGVAGAGAARALCRDAPARPRRDRPEPHARGAAAADQGLSAARRLCRRRRGDRRAVQHDRCLHRRQDRPRRPRNTRAITSANRKTHGRRRGAWTLGSALRFWRLGVVSRLDRAADAGAGARVWRCGGAGSRRSRASTTAGAAAFSAPGARDRPAGRARGRCCSPPTTSPISTSRCWARCSPPRSSPRPRSPAGRCSAGWRELQRSVFIDRRVRSTAQQRDSIAGAARRQRGADPVSRGDERRRQPACCRSRARCSASPITRRRGAGRRCSRCRSPIRGSTACRSGARCGRSSPGMASMALAPHLWRMLGLGTVEVVVEFHPPTTPGRMRLAQGAGALLRGAGRGGPRRRA